MMVELDKMEDASWEWFTLSHSQMNESMKYCWRVAGCPTLWVNAAYAGQGARLARLCAHANRSESGIIMVTIGMLYLMSTCNMRSLGLQQLQYSIKLVPQTTTSTVQIVIAVLILCTISFASQPSKGSSKNACFNFYFLISLVYRCVKPNIFVCVGIVKRVWLSQLPPSFG